MCLSTVYIDSDGQRDQVMQDVSQMQAQNDGFVLTGLLGEQKFVEGKIKSIDFIREHAVLLEKT